MACSCIGPGKIYKSNDHAFTGRLVERERVNQYKTDFTYRIIRVYKDSPEMPLAEGDEITFRSSSSSSACGLPSRVGKRYGEIPYVSRGELQANLCTTTGPKQLRRIARRNGEERSARGAAPVNPCSPAVAAAGRTITRVV